MDDNGKYEYWELPYLQDWAIKVSGIKDIKIYQMFNMDYIINASAWCSPKCKIIYLNYDLLSTYPYIGRDWMKATILHEIGHTFAQKHRGAANEYKAHEWAMKKCVKLGMESQLYFLRCWAMYFGTGELRNFQEGRYYRAYKWFKRKSII